MRKYIKNNYAILLALIAALLFGINAPLSKILLLSISPMLLASLLYLGAGLGMLILYLFKQKKDKEASLNKNDSIWVILMIILDIIAPFFLLYGLKIISAANASLLFNFEMVATSIVALLIFKEAIGKRIWIAISLITVSSILLTFNFNIKFELDFSLGAILVLLACITWGFENNITRNISHKNPYQIVILKGFGSGIGALLVFLITKTNTINVNIILILYALLLGFISYGLSIFFYIKAQRFLGASRTSSLYAAAPFLGVIISFILFNESLTISFVIALVIMIIGVYLIANEKHAHIHTHTKISHKHSHSHSDLHHNHSNEDVIHAHSHTHEKTTHSHVHRPDIHHRHKHKN